MKKRIYYVSAGISLFLLFLFWGVVSTNAEQNNLGFTVRNIRVKNQLSEGNYVDLLLKPGEHQTIFTEVTNTTAKEITIIVTLNDATTTEAGTINYSTSQTKNTANLPFKLQDIVKIPKRITLEKGETKKMKLELTMPAKKFQGVLLGGIQLQQEEDTTEIKPQQSSVVENSYAYIYSLSIRQSEIEVQPKLSHNPSLSQNHTYSSFNNDSGKIIRDMTVEMTLLETGTNKVIEHQKMEQLKMAPHSTINIPFKKQQSATKKLWTKTTVRIANRTWNWTDTQQPSKKPKMKEENDKIYRAVCVAILLLVVSFLTIIICVKKYKGTAKF